MKFFLAICITIVVAANAANVDFKEKFKQIGTECRAENVIPDEEFAKFKAGEIAEPSQAIKCFTNCFQEKAGILKGGVYQEDVVIAMLSPIHGEDKVKSTIEACRGVTGSDKCDTAYKTHECFKKNGAY